MMRIVSIHAGFPSPADDYVEISLSLQELLIPSEPSTYFFRVRGQSMEPLICSGDLLIVDRGITASPNDIVIAQLSGHLTVKRLHRHNGVITLGSDSQQSRLDFDSLSEDGFQIWGVVTSIVRQLRGATHG